jgi:hypothetical protein
MDFSNVSTDVLQIGSQKNICSGGSNFGCSNSEGSETSIGGTPAGTNANKTVVSNVNAKVVQKNLGLNKCSADTVCINSGGTSSGGENTVQIAASTDVLRCCPIEVNSNTHLNGLNANLSQETSQVNDCNRNPLIGADIGAACDNSQGIGNLISIGTTESTFGFSSPFASNLNLADINTNVSQTLDQKNNCHDNADCVFNTGQNSFKLGSFSAVQFPQNEESEKLNVSQINAVAKQSLKQSNDCSNVPSFQSCTNQAANNIRIGSPNSFGANVDLANSSFNLKETVEQQNRCKNNIICSNDAENVLSTGSGDAIGLTKISNIVLNSSQHIIETNECKDGNAAATCKTEAHNVLTTDNPNSPGHGSGSGESITGLSASSSQTVMQDNECEFGSSCSETGTNTVGTTSSQEAGQAQGSKEQAPNRVTLHQIEQQENKCKFDSSCSDSSVTSASIDTAKGGDEKIIQQTSQENNCLFDSNCTNQASTLRTTDSSGLTESPETQSLSQANQCVSGSTCSNKATVGDANSGSIQSNTCVDGSNCNNEGTNNVTMCVKGGNCDNTGIDTKVVSKGEDCQSGPNGSLTVCANGHTITS